MRKTWIGCRCRRRYACGVVLRGGAFGTGRSSAGRRAGRRASGRAAADVVGDRERGVEDADPRPGVVVAGRVGSRVWVTTATPDGKALGVVAVDARAGEIVHDLKLFDVATPQFRAPLQHLRLADAGRGRGASTSPSGRPAPPRLERQDRQGAVEAARLRVQPLPRRRLVADPLPRPADHALRRQRSSVRRRARQEDRQDGVADRSIDRFQGSESPTAPSRPRATSARPSRRRT